LKIHHLNKLINFCLYIKDFVKAGQYIDEYVKQRYDGYENYVRLMDNIRELITWIKKELNAKTNSNICNVILDAVDKIRMTKLTFLQDLQKNALSFANVWSTSPYTNGSYYSICTGSDIVTAKLNYKSNVYVQAMSQMPKLKRFSDNGFTVRMFSYLDKIMLKNAFNDYRAAYIPNCSKIIWDYLDYAVATRDNTLCFVHILLETHNPYYNIYNEDEVFVSVIDSERPIELSQNAELLRKCTELQIDAGLRNVDAQLRYYFEGTDFDLVIANDHGDRGLTPHLNGYASILTLRSKCISPGVYNKLFSYVDLLDMEFTLAMERKFILPEREFVLLAMDPVYSGDINYIIKSIHIIDQIKGHLAILTEEDYYVQHLDGQERYFLRSDLDTDLSGDPQYAERIKYLYNLLDKRDYSEIYKQEKYKKFHNYLRVFTQYEGKRNN
jgi:hypothetical protein